jgi:O-antigen/teichoic acid export membrane protein
VNYLGLYSLGNSITNIATVIGKAGMDLGLMRFISQSDVQEDTEIIKKDIASTLKIGLAISLIVMLLQIVLSRWLTENIFHESSLLKTVLIVNAMSIPFVVVLMISIHATQGFRLLKYKIFVEYVLNPTILLLSMILVFYLSTPELAIVFPFLITGIIGSFIASTFLKNVAGTNMLSILHSKIDTKILTYSLPIMFTAIFGTLLHWMDVIMLGYFTNSEIVGLYHPAVRTAGLQNSVFIAFSGIFTPMFSRYFAKSDNTNMNHIYQLVVRWILTIIVPILILVLLFSKKIMLLFGAEFLQSADVLIILAIGTSILSFLGVGGAALVVSGYPKLNLMNAIFATIINVTLNILLIPKYGIIGAAWATLTSMLFIALARTVEVRLLLKIFPFNIKILKAITSGLITILVMNYVKPQIMEFHTIITLIFAILAILIVYGIFMFIFKFDEDDIDFLKSVNLLKNSVFDSRK